MQKIDLTLPGKFMDACVAKDQDKALRLAKLMAEQHNCTLKAELDILDFDVAGMLICLGAVGFVVFVL